MYHDLKSGSIDSEISCTHRFRVIIEVHRFSVLSDNLVYYHNYYYHDLVDLV